MIKNSKIVLKSCIDKNDYDVLKNLEELCAEYDSLSFKLELDYRLENAEKLNKREVELNEFMYYVENELAGYINISNFGGDDLEITGMVHPAYRNKGIFTQLFTLVQDECNKRKSDEILLLCDNKSHSGISFIEKFSQKYHHSEYDMILNRELFPQQCASVLNIRRAAESDAKIISEMNYDFFGIIIREGDTALAENIANGRTFIAEADNGNIGSVRIELNDSTGGIYGLGVLSEYRGRGYGRELLIWSVEKLIEMGAERVILQVDTDNGNALNLYKSCGFEDENVMSYYVMRR
ncbi:MAG TPA: GNAT family N-acetyltransferase [Clostridiales bacterium]|nr:GNAT family N-acetyltransferase [Clostridiales bacterium]